MILILDIISIDGEVKCRTKNDFFCFKKLFKKIKLFSKKYIFLKMSENK